MTDARVLQYPLKPDPNDDTGSIALRALAIDDDPDYLAYISSLLRSLGLRVQTACRGDEALALLRGEEYDLLVVDLRMPSLDGMETLQRVRNEREFRGLYSVLLTGDDSSETRLAALDGGFDEFVSKSTERLELLALLRSASRVIKRQRKLKRENEALRELATTDPLTGIANRRYLFDRLNQMLYSGIRPINVALFDLDDFKIINDTHGHMVGDRVLADIGSLFQKQTRFDDVIARYGGDEFALLVPTLSPSEALAIAERLGRQVAALQWPVGSETLQVGVTVGLVSTAVTGDLDPEELFALSDANLYEKKRARIKK